MNPYVSLRKSQLPEMQQDKPANNIQNRISRTPAHIALPVFFSMFQNCKKSGEISKAGYKLCDVHNARANVLNSRLPKKYTHKTIHI